MKKAILKKIIQDAEVKRTAVTELMLFFFCITVIGLTVYLDSRELTLLIVTSISLTAVLLYLILFIKVRNEIKFYQKYMQLIELKELFSDWKEDDDDLAIEKMGFVIYYNEKFKEWQFKDLKMTGSYSNMDINKIEFPIGWHTRNYVNDVMKKRNEDL